MLDHILKKFHCCFSRTLTLLNVKCSRSIVSVDLIKWSLEIKKWHKILLCNFTITYENGDNNKKTWAKDKTQNQKKFKDTKEKSKD